MVMYVILAMNYGYLNYVRIQINGEMVCYMTMKSIMFN